MKVCWGVGYNDPLNKQDRLGLSPDDSTFWPDLGGGGVVCLPGKFCSGVGIPGVDDQRKPASSYWLISAPAAWLLIDAEDYEEHPYNDSENNCTVGIGHLIHEGVCNGADVAEYSPTSRGEAFVLWTGDVYKAVSGVHANITAEITRYEFDALVLFSFQGKNILSLSHMLRGEINKGHRQWDPDVIQEEWDWGRHQCGTSPGLCIRRDAEVGLFLTGRYPARLTA